MIDTDKLRGLIVEKRKTQEQVAKHLEISSKTFYLKMQKGIFNSDEIEKMIDFLEIDDPMHIFFAKKTT